MSAHTYDVAIIGGGIVGCSILFELTRQGYKSILCEAQPNIMSGASAGNSGMLHTGFDAPLNSTELKCIQICQGKIFDLLERANIPYEKCGAYVVAWTPQEKEKLHNLYQHSLAAKIDTASVVTTSDLYRAEPCLSLGALGALHVPGEAVLDSNLLGVCLAHHARRQKAKILTDCKVTSFSEKTLYTTQGPITTKVTINCAGLYGDMVDSLAGVNNFVIKPRKGQYCVFKQADKSILQSMIFPVPTDRTKGVVLFRSVYGNLLLGPTAEEVNTRDHLAPDPNLHRTLIHKAWGLLPQLKSCPVAGSYVGIRPATQWKDYQIKTYPDIGWVTVGGIRSTGVSGSLGIAQYVCELVKKDMCLQPSQGCSLLVDDISWKTATDRASVLIDDTSYKMSHPIFQFGHENHVSRL